MKKAAGFREQMVDVIRETVGTLHAAREHTRPGAPAEAVSCPGGMINAVGTRAPLWGVALPETKPRQTQEGALRHQVRLSMDRKWAPWFLVRPHRHAA